MKIVHQGYIAQKKNLRIVLHKVLKLKIVQHKVLNQKIPLHKVYKTENNSA